MNSKEAKKILQKALRNRHYPEGPGDEEIVHYGFGMRVFRAIMKFMNKVIQFIGDFIDVCHGGFGES